MSDDMEVQADLPPPRTAFTFGKDLRLLLTLLVIAAAIHVWLFEHTAVMSRDGIGFITYAWQLEHYPWPDVMRHNAQHPLYPIAILAASGPVRHLTTGALCDQMMMSAQLVCSVCGVLLVVPMYFVGKTLFHRGVGFWAALLFQCFPISARVTADALSEGLFLLLVACALWTAVYAVRRGSWRWCALCGFLSGLAYLTRPEGAAVAAAAGLVLLGCQCSSTWRRPWGVAIGCALSLCVGLVLAGGPYVAVIGRLTGKQTALESVGLAAHWPTMNAVGPVSVGGHPLAVSTLAVFLEWGSQHRAPGLRGFCQGLWCLATELDRGFHHVSWLFAGLGLYWYRRRLEPGAWTLLAVCLLQLIAMCGLVFIVGYLADRHVLIVVMCGLFWAVAAVQDLPYHLAVSCRGASLAILLALAASGLPKTLQPLHPQRAGHRVAGHWLAEHVRKGDMLEDPYYWAAYYAGWDFGPAEPRKPDDRNWNHYIVVERSSNPHVRLSLIKSDIVERGTVVFRCPLRAGKQGQDIVEIRTINFTHDAVKPPPMRNIP
jgi:hypothetical protein